MSNDQQTANPTPPKTIRIDRGRLRFAPGIRTKARVLTKGRWRNANLLALSAQSCAKCFGLGRRPGSNGRETVCGCVCRQICALCLARFRQCVLEDGRMGQVAYEVRSGGGRASYGMRNEEYAADFLLVAFRTLNGGKTRSQLQDEGVRESLLWRIFTMHFLLGADWKLCTRKLGIDRGPFFHEVYRIQEALGVAFAETEPFSLFPIDEYFSPGFQRHSSTDASSAQSEAPKPKREVALTMAA